ncbi:hypothetical protein L6164_032426 [Bauhinia variegata]|uniref:Uncharacterized protein n=1 Tax=Bauhinia variegata TaxID=167791 RepID=A0ACB9KNT3_BAUVA|nr:hypothetical protein L6164_032426 [Bauhinia variegata]
MLMVYDDPSDQRSQTLDDRNSTEESPDETRLSLEKSNDAIPYIGQRFASHDAAYEFYSEFAKRCGFSIRRHRTEGKDGVGKGLTRRYFVCHRAGNTPVKTSTESIPQRNRKSSRCSCHQFEFSGILCRHALRVLSTGNCFQIPDMYLPIGWRRISMPSAKPLQSAPNDHAERVQQLQNMVSSLITESAKSKEKLDLAKEQVSILLSRIRAQPISLQGVRDMSTINRNF